MFGTYRTLLAFFVAGSHLISIPVIGHYSVHGFFILSGYLMTYVMSNSYGYSFLGVKSFAINRFLRLYPIYWAVILLSLGFVFLWGENQSIIYRDSYYIPEKFSEWLQNITMIFANVFPNHERPRISPPVWALTIELFFYFLIALGLSRTKLLTTVWVVLSIMFTVVTHLLNFEYDDRYYNILSGSLPFAIGAFTYHYRKPLCSLLSDKNPRVFVILLFVFFVNALVAELFGGRVSAACYYLNYVVNAALIIFLIKGRIPYINQKLDQKIGDYSYPLYLLHWQVGFFVSMLIWQEPIRGLNAKGIVSFALALVLCFFVSYVIIRFIDHPIQKLRSRVKQNISNS